ncbi:hypothetical protein OPV22_010669 [Ensete ventricosum]|uniref:Uncharacterized protein n=1 Tax=Ensete ventricosum TaxID=4639 RepID=A0AAV8RLV3_ENSVE|nr:hypothetical protein OPV22_010669 [Ensete ventricosum]
MPPFSPLLPPPFRDPNIDPLRLKVSCEYKCGICELPGGGFLQDWLSKGTEAHRKSRVDVIYMQPWTGTGKTTIGVIS